MIFHRLPLPFVGSNALCRSGVSLPTSLISAFAVSDGIPHSKLRRALRPSPAPAGLLHQPLPAELSRAPPAKFIHVGRCHHQGGGPQGDADALEFLLEIPLRFSLRCLRPLIINAWNNAIKVEADGLEIITAFLLCSISLFAPRFFLFFFSPSHLALRRPLLNFARIRTPPSREPPLSLSDRPANPGRLY